MVFYRRKRYVKKRGMKRRLKRYSKPTVRKLAKRVRGISRSLRKATEWTDWTEQKPPTDAVSPFQQFHINNYGNWTPTFLQSRMNTGANAEVAQAGWSGLDWIRSRVSMDFKLDAEYKNITYTVFLIQLKDQFRNTQFDDATGTLTLTAGVHYNMTEGMAMLNKRFFVIRGIRKFTLGNFGANPTTVGDAGGSIDDYRRVTFRLRPNKKILRQDSSRVLVGPAAAAANSALPDPDPSKNYYVLVFNNDSDATYQKINYRADHVCKSY